MNIQHCRGLCALSIFAALAAVSCLGPTGIEVGRTTSITRYEGITWKGEAAGHDDALAKWGTPAKDWMYRNTVNKSVYRHNGVDWIMVVNGTLPTVPASIQISGSYITPAGYLPARLYFTDGGIADGYVDNTSGVVMLYDDVWNDQTGTGKTFHTLKLLTSKQNILLSRAFDPGDPVLLNIGADGKLRFRAAETNNPNDPGVPYIPIDTVGELALIERDAAARSGTYLLKRNLDMLGAPSGGAILAPRPHNWTPIGNGAPFTGTFDGAGKALANLYCKDIVSHVPLGLFSKVDGGSIKNLHIQSGVVWGIHSVGGIVGAMLAGTIENASNNALVQGDEKVGGVVGENNGTITACRNTGMVVGNHMVMGGVAGYNNGYIIACYNTGTVEGGAFSGTGPGGVVGENNGTLSACYNAGETIPPAGYAAGGVVDIDRGMGLITACYWVLGKGATDGISSGSHPETKVFNGAGWPAGNAEPAIDWRIGSADGRGPGRYWKSMGVQSGSPGPADFPKLWWETP